MKKYILIIFLILSNSQTSAAIKEKIVKILSEVDNVTFDFEQNVGGSIENGTCTIKYPKKIFCKYNLKNKKVLVSDGRSLVIKTNSSYYLYPLDKTPLYFILDKNFLLNKINNLNERVIDDKFVNYKFKENNTEISIFFDVNTYNLIGWQTLDIYQNITITYLSSIKKNRTLDKNIFLIPDRN